MSFFGGSGSVAVGLQGGYKYQSPQSRALGTINIQSYQHIYDDQSKVMSKLVGDVSYLAASDKKQQGGIDKANENIFEQLQDMIADFIVLLGGGGDTGFDFGDLKYVLIGLGSLFGFGDGHGGLTIPLNPFTMAWHFFSTWLVPVDGFRDLFDLIIDTAIATILDFFGTTPILGQALEQLAQILSTLRDELDPLLSAIDGLFDLFDIDLGDTDSWLDFWGPFKPLFEFLGSLFEPYLEDGLEQFNDLFAYLITWTTPFTTALTFNINAFTNIIENLDLTAATITQIGTFFGNIWALLNNIVFSADDFEPLDAWIQIAEAFLIPAGLIATEGFQLLIDAIAGGFNLATGLTAELLGAGIYEVINGILAITADFTALLSATSTASGIILGALVTAASTDASFAATLLNNILNALSITAADAYNWFSNLLWLLGNPINMAASDVADIILSTDPTDFPILGPVYAWINGTFNDILTALGLSFLSDLPGALASTATKALSAFNDWATFLSGLSQASAAALVTFVHGIDTNALSAVGQLTTIFSNGIITTASQLADWILDSNNTLIDLLDGTLVFEILTSWSNILSSLGVPTTGNITTLLTSWTKMLSALGSMTTGNITSLLTNWANVLTSLGSLTTAQITTLLTSWSTILGSGGLGAMSTGNITTVLTNWSNMLTGLGSMTTGNITSLLTNWANVLTSLGALTAAQIKTLFTSWATVLNASGLGAMSTANITGLLTNWSNMLTSLGSMTTGNITSLLTNWANVLISLGGLSSAQITSLLVSWATILGSGGLGALTSAQITTLLTSWSTIFAAGGLGALTTGNITSALTSWANMATALGAMTTGSITTFLGSWTNIFTALGAFSTTIIGNLLGTWANVITGLGALSSTNVTNLITTAFTSAQVTTILSTWTNIFNGLGAFTSTNVTNILASWANVLTGLGALTAAQIKTLLTSWTTVLNASGLSAMTSANITSLLTSWSTILGVGGLGALTTGNITTLLTSWSNMITGLGALTTGNITNALTSWSFMLTGLGSMTTGNITSLLTNWANILTSLGSLTTAQITTLLTSWTNILGVGGLGAFTTGNITSLLTNWGNLFTGLGAFTSTNVTNILASWANVLTGLGSMSTSQITTLLTNWANIATSLGGMSNANINAILGSWFNSSGVFTGSMSSYAQIVNWATGLAAATFNAAQITAGTFATSLIPNITAAMSTDMQTAVDALANAFTGGTYGVPITPTPTYGSTGAGIGWASGNNSFAHTVVGNSIVVLATWAATATPPTFSIGTIPQNIPLLGSAFQYDSVNNVWLGIYGLMNPPTGAQTVSCVGGAGTFINACSVSYSAASGFGTPVFTSATGTALAQTATCLATDLVINGFGDLNANMSAYTRNQRYLRNIVGSVNWGLLVGDASISSTSVSFGATGSTSVKWGSVVLPIHGITTITHASPSIIASALASIPASLINGVWSSLLTNLGAFTTANITAAFTNWSNMLTGLGSMTTGNITSLLTNWANVLTSLGSLSTAQITTLLTSWTTILGVGGLGAFTTGNITTLLASWANMFTALGAFGTTAIGNLFGSSWVTLVAALGAMSTANIGTLLGSAWTNLATALGGMTNANINAILGSWFNSSGQFTGILNAASQFGGFALSTVLQYLTPSSGLWNAAGIAGALNLAGITANSVALSTFFTGGLLNAAQLGGTIATAMLDQIATAVKALINNVASGVPNTLAGFASVLNDLAKSVGIPTQLGSGSPVLSTLPNAPGVLGITQGFNDGIALANQGVSAFLTQASTDYNSAMTAANQMANQFISAVIPHWF